MEPLILLGLGKMEIDWTKNLFLFRDHSALFKPEDVKLVPYYYADEEDENGDYPIITRTKEGLSRKLSSVKKRLDLLGYTLEKARSLYDELVIEDTKYNSGIQCELSFDDFALLLKEVDINKIDTTVLSADSAECGYDFGEFARKCIIAEEEIYAHLPLSLQMDNYALSYLLENMDPYVVLRLLAENPHCADLDVYWCYTDAVESGIVEKDSISQPLSKAKKIMIVTEGSSDSFIIRRTIDELFPDISDFFSFIDMEKNYPFTGTGNLYNFCQGLMKIDIINNIIVIFDNDTAGNEQYSKLMCLPQVENLLITKLPDCKAFEQIETLGPQGATVENINGVAVAIECFLDFNSCSYTPTIRWTSYNKKARKYQGELQYKDDYVSAFKQADLHDGSYNISKLKSLVEYVLAQWLKKQS